jgi:hypothetical protein
LPANAWRTDDGVLISDVPAPVAAPGSLAPAAATAPVRKPGEQPAAAPGFVPQPAVEVPRKAARMPEIGDFPDPIQKAYAERLPAAAASAVPPAPAAAEPRNTAVQASAEPASDPRKGGLFRRLAEVARGRPRTVETNPQDEEMPDFLTTGPRGRRQGSA